MPAYKIGVGDLIKVFMKKVGKRVTGNGDGVFGTAMIH